jgi:SAM-dependent methyltransferase
VPRSALYGDLAEYYDRIYARKDYAAEAKRLRTIARRYLRRPGRSLLDVACGTGQHLAEFRKYFDVAGVDLSPEMLRVARRKLGPEVPLDRGDMRSFALGRQFDVVVCLFSAIGYLTTRRDRDRALRRFFEHVSPGGVLLVEGWIRPSRWRRSGIHLQTYDGADAKIARVTLSSRTGAITRLEMHYLIAEPGRPVRHLAERHVNALVDSEEMLGSFRRAGFRGRILLGKAYRDRGLYVGVRPVEPSPPGRPRARRGRGPTPPRASAVGAR